MDVTITVRVCDTCKDRNKPATRYSLTPEGVKPVERDLCDEHGAPIREAFGLTEASTAEPADDERKAPAQRKPPAKRTEAATKAAEAKPQNRRRGKTQVRTLEEIEAAKQAAQS